MVTFALAAWSAMVATVSLRALWPGRPPPVDRSPGDRFDVLVVRPCAGREPRLAETLHSTRQLPQETRVVFAVAHEDDPALPIAREACAALREAGRDARVQITDAVGPNQKSSQLARVLGDTPCAVVVVIDSDVDCGTVDLPSLVAAVRTEGVGAAWCPVVEDGGETLGDRASDALLAGSLHAFPLLARLDPAGLVGKVLALRRDVLDAVGGFTPLARYLGEDMELSRRLHAHGWRTVALPTVAVSRARGRSWDDVVARYARWIMVIRAQRPTLLWSYPLLFFATPWLVAGGLLTKKPAVAAVAIIARLLVAVAARRASKTPVARAWGDLFWSDGVLLCAFVRALRTRVVTWRGRKLTVAADGTLHEVEAPSPSREANTSSPSTARA
jgi:ceramide glucosyltransferase